MCCHSHTLLADDKVEKSLVEIMKQSRLAVNKIYNQDLAPGQPDETLVKTIAEFLWEGTKESFLSNFTYADPDQDFLMELRKNTYIFTTFKNHQFAVEIAGHLYDPETGDLKTFEKFLSDVEEIEKSYNQNWLRSEYNTAVSSGESAARWKQYEAQSEDTGLSFLQYDAVRDQRTRPEHAALDGVVYAIGDKFWDTWMPPNGWNCRCDIRLVAGPGKASKNIPEIQTGFDFNPGKTATIVSEKHPYYQVDPVYQDAAENNFGIDIPEDESKK